MVGISGTRSLPRVGWVCPGVGGYPGHGTPVRFVPTHSLDMGPRIQRDTVGKRAGSILLECFLVNTVFLIELFCNQLKAY